MFCEIFFDFMVFHIIHSKAEILALLPYLFGKHGKFHEAR